MPKFTPPTPEELAARGLNPDGTPIKVKPAKQPKAAKPAEPAPAEE